MRSILIHSPARRESAEIALASRAGALLLQPAGEGESREAALRWMRAFVERARASADRPQLFVQVAPVTDAAIDADLIALVAAGLDGVFLEGCEGRAHVQHLSAKLSVREAAAGLPAGSVKIIALAAQTPAGVFALGGYKDASTRLAGLTLDGTALPGGSGARDAARALLLLGAASARLPAFDMAPDLEGAALEKACAAARREGFAGMIARSGAQIGPIESAYCAA